MKIGVDSYSFHRYFGEVYPFQQPSCKQWTLEDFLHKAHEWRLEGVALESCFMQSFNERALHKLRDLLDQYRLERVWAWGHPFGLEGGKSKRALKDLEDHFDHADRIGARVMRIVGGSRHQRENSRSALLKRLAGVLKEMVLVAEQYGIALALENHMDLNATEMLEVIHKVDSKWLGINMDTGNNLRLFEDSVEECRMMAPYTLATHIKDIGVGRGAPKEFAFWPSVPLGTGLVDIAAIVCALRQCNYDGLYCVEIDYLHEQHDDEEAAVTQSVEYLRGLRDRS